MDDIAESASHESGRGDILEAAPSDPDRRFPGFQMPFGWFSLGHSDEFADEAATARRVCDADVVVWRDHAGTAVVQDSYCPHLGANLAVGGTIDRHDGAACIRCPFHHWAFDASGTNVDIPYAERTNASAIVPTYPSVEVNGMVFFWWHPDRTVAPMWDLPEIASLRGGDYDLRQAWTIDAPWQEFSENGSDTAHFASVHGSPKVAHMEESDYSFPTRRMFVRNSYPTKSRGPVDGTQETITYGPGLGITDFSIDGAHMYLVATQAPLSATRTVARFAWFYGDDPLSQKLGPYFSAEVEKQFAEDLPIWNHKRHVRRPALAATDGPIGAYRKWAALFYAAEPASAGATSETVTPPEPAQPTAPSEIATEATQAVDGNPEAGRP